MRDASLNWKRLLILLAALGIIFFLYYLMSPVNTRTVKTSFSNPAATVPPSLTPTQIPVQSTSPTTLQTPVPVHRSIIPPADGGEGGSDN